MVLLDTDILIPYLRKDVKIKNKVSDLISRNLLLSTTTINVAELYLGAYLSKKKKENLNSVKNLISKLDIISFNTNHGRIYGELKAKLQKRGTIINELDIFIAAIVLERDTRLITRNIRHFEKISGLKIEKW
jgi:tRNA(fMet)-specific endonuclease VapC